MLKSLVESKLLTNFLIIEDKEDLNCQNLFVSFLENQYHDNSVKKINLISYENSPEFYIKSQTPLNEKVALYDYFSQSLKWDNTPVSKTDLSFFLSNPQNLGESVFFIDSISTLVYYHGYNAVYRNLCNLKKHSKKIICIVHGDLFTSDQLEELYFLATSYIKILDFIREKNTEEIICEVTHHKPGGKVIKQKELFFIDDDFNVSGKIQKSEIPISTNSKTNIETLTTFKLGLHMSDQEKKARDELILPYVKTNKHNKREEFIRQPMIHELEDDPDDDLEI